MPVSILYPSRWFGFASALGLALVAFSPLAAQDPQASGEEDRSPPADIREYQDYVAAGSGRWETEKRYAQAGGDSVRYTLHYWWELNGHLLRYTVGQKDASGERQVLFQGYSAWHPGEGKMVLLQVGPDGRVATGEHVVTENGGHAGLMHGSGPTGPHVRLRDVNHRLGPDVMVDTTYIARDGEWRPVGIYTWRRVER